MRWCKSTVVGNLQVFRTAPRPEVHVLHGIHDDPAAPNDDLQCLPTLELEGWAHGWYDGGVGYPATYQTLILSFGGLAKGPAVGVARFRSLPK